MNLNFHKSGNFFVRFGFWLPVILLLVLVGLHLSFDPASAAPFNQTLPQARQEDSYVGLGTVLLGIFLLVTALIVRFTYHNFAPKYTQVVTSALPVNQIWTEVDAIFPRRNLVGQAWSHNRPTANPNLLVLSTRPISSGCGCLMMVFTGLLLGFLAWLLVGKVEQATVTLMPEGDAPTVKVEAVGYKAVTLARKFVARLENPLAQTEK